VMRMPSLTLFAYGNAPTYHCEWPCSLNAVTPLQKGFAELRRSAERFVDRVLRAGGSFTRLWSRACHGAL
jgi:hypothetical protein